MVIPDIVKRIGMIDAPDFVLRLLPTTTSDTVDMTWATQAPQHLN